VKSEYRDGDGDEEKTFIGERERTDVPIPELRSRIWRWKKIRADCDMKFSRHVSCQQLVSLDRIWNYSKNEGLTTLSSFYHGLTITNDHDTYTLGFAFHKHYPSLKISNETFYRSIILILDATTFLLTSNAEMLNNGCK